MAFQFYISPENYARAAANGIRRLTLEYRVRTAAWPLERAITEPVPARQNHGHWTALAAANGISHQVFYGRLKRDWSYEQAATQPLTSRSQQQDLCRQAKFYQKRYPPEIVAQAEANGVSRQAFYGRVKRGWTIEAAASTPPISYAENGRRSTQIVRERYGDINKSVFKKRG